MFSFLLFLATYKEDRHVAFTAQSAVNATWRAGVVTVHYSHYLDRSRLRSGKKRARNTTARSSMPSAHGSARSTLREHDRAVTVLKHNRSVQCALYMVTWPSEWPHARGCANGEPQTNKKYPGGESTSKKEICERG